MGRMLAWGGIVLGVIYLVYVGGGWWGIYSPYLRITSMGIAAAALAVWAITARRNPAWRPRSALSPVIVTCLASLAISTMFSRAPRVSLEYLGYAVVLAALYLLLVRLFADPFFRRRLAVLATMLMIVSTIAFLGQVGLGWLRWWELAGGFTVPPLRPGFPGLTYNNPSAALTMVTLLAVPAVATFGAGTRRGVAFVIAVVFAIGVVALVSGSRAGWFALGLTALIAPVAWLAVADNRATARAAIGEAFGRRWVRLGVVAAGVTSVAFAVVLAPSILRRALESGQDLRITYAAAGIRMFEEAPMVGTGPGTWVIQRPHYTVPPDTDYFIPHAHNLEAQTLAELGLLGAVAGVVLVIGILWLLRDAIRGDDPLRRRWAWVGGTGLLYFALHQVLDFYVNMPAFLFAAAIPVAYLDATSASGARSPWPLRWPPVTLGRLATMVGSGLVVLSIAGLLLQEVPALRQAQAVAAAGVRDWAAADGPAREAAAMDPDVGSYQLTAGLTAARSGDHAAAAEYFERVVSRDDLPEAWLNLAAEQALLGQSDAALASLGSALRLGYQRPAVAMPAGDLALRLGDADLAISAFGAAIARAPTLAGDRWWRADAERAAILALVLAHAVAIAPGTRWEIALETGDEALARQLAAGDERTRLITAVWFGDRSAAGALTAGCGANVLDISLLAWCARIEGRAGHAAAANTYRQLASLINLGAGSITAELRVSDAGMVGEQLPGEPADLWATYTYRRPAPWDILVPSLVHLTLE